MSEPIQRLTLFVPGAPASLEAWGEALEPLGARLEGETLHADALDAPVELEWIPSDGSFPQAFSFGTVDDETLAQLDAAPGALVLYPTVDLKEGREQVVTLVEHLRDAGAIAVRLESSKLGWDAARWVEIFGSDDPWAWHKGAVAFLDGDDHLQSCGMHAFSLPDVRVPLDGDAAERRHLGAILNVYQIDEDPLLLSGQTFAPDAETPKRVVERWPDDGYPAGHPCNNPYGVWRLGPPGGSARELPNLLPVFVPSLGAILLNRQGKQAEPLTREDVEATRDGAVCIALAPLNAQSMERSRGYADLNPEFVWEQWQILRKRPD